MTDFFNDVIEYTRAALGGAQPLFAILAFVGAASQPKAILLCTRYAKSPASQNNPIAPVSQTNCDGVLIGKSEGCGADAARNASGKS
jgi:hypothetical protein